MNKKLVFFDADGTIIDYNIGGIVADSTREAIKKLKENGHIPVISTGRSYNMIDRLAEELGIDYLAVLNGAQIFYKEKLLFSKSLGEEKSMLLIERTNTKNIGLLAFDAEFIYYRNISDKWKEFINASINMESNMIPIDGGPYDFASFYVYGDDEVLEKAFEGIEGIEFHNGRHEITREGASKGYAVQKLAKYLKIPIADTIAFGDGLNDISMLETAGTGIAMKHGRQEVLEVVEKVTEAGEDAISNYLEKLGLIYVEGYNCLDSE